MTCTTHPTAVVPRLALLNILQCPLVVGVPGLSIIAPLLMLLPVLLLLLPLVAVAAVVLLLVGLMVVPKTRLLCLLLLLRLLLLCFLESGLLRPRALLLIWVGQRMDLVLLAVGRLVLLGAEAPSVWRDVLVRRRPVLRVCKDKTEDSCIGNDEMKEDESMYIGKD